MPLEPAMEEGSEANNFIYSTFDVTHSLDVELPCSPIGNFSEDRYRWTRDEMHWPKASSSWDVLGCWEIHPYRSSVSSSPYLGRHSVLYNAVDAYSINVHLNTDRVEYNPMKLLTCFADDDKTCSMVRC